MAQRDDTTEPFFATSSIHMDDVVVPPLIGRYRISKLIGKGGFGLVYLAHDDQLERLVAIKVPHAQLVAQATQAEAYLREARTVAGLDHPHIVPVFDVGSTEQFPFFVVSKYIDGSDLSKRLEQGRPTIHEAAELVAAVADALHYAHNQRLVHRDIKPGNILLDKNDKPFVADFGVALREQDVGKGPRYAGTPAYMSPEQARGEGHRVDGRSDTFGLGVVLYEMLAGRRPFKADSKQELLEQVRTFEARPLRQYDDSIPKELERICLKALSKRVSERYTTTKDLADDLRQFLTESPWADQSQIPAELPIENTVTSQDSPSSPPLASDSQLVRIVPKGLRSFDAHDADFFLELLPGPRDRNGLPDSIRFWKSRIEETEGDKTFSVGLICGPSGCGKSSLVKAGLLPHLADDVIVVFIEATDRETETRLLHGVRKRCPQLPDNLTLKETLSLLRRGQGVSAGKKVLIVIDQFEQWLHTQTEDGSGEFTQAMRQCEGSKVQCLVIVRDDFWMAVIRFMRELEIPLIEGHNSAAIDLFSIRHARKVLAAFGRAFGALADSSSELTKDQNSFLEQAVAGLAQDGKVVSVRLALFAEMMKSRAWTPATLKEVGGSDGVGITFLEETFNATTSPPKYRYHQRAARADLQALLPATGSDIKGHMRSYAELLEASGYGNRPEDFDDLIRILDGEIRLITPTDPEGSADADTSQVQDGTRYYQLTHDYLVHSLREWLTRKQKETLRGRAELLLIDRSSEWNSRPENRHLPSLLHWLQIQWLTTRRTWTPPQRRMLARAGQYHGIRSAALLFMVAVLALTGLSIRQQIIERDKENYATGLVGRVFDADITQVPGIIREMKDYRVWVDPRLKAEQIKSSTDPRKQLHASIALLPADSSQVNYLYDRLLHAKPHELAIIREALVDHKQAVSERLWTLLVNRQQDQDQRFRAACALAVLAPDDRRWEQVARDVAATLVNQEPFVIAHWAETLKRARTWIAPALADFLVDDTRSLSAKNMIASVYGNLTADNPNAHVRLEQFLGKLDPVDAPAADKMAFSRQQASVATALLMIGKSEHVWPLLKYRPDLTLRSYLINRMEPGRVDPKSLTDRLQQETDLWIKRAILLSLGDYGLDRLSFAQRQSELPSLLKLYQTDPDPGIHAAAEWLLRRWQGQSELEVIEKTLATGKVEDQRRWYITRQGQTMAIVPAPGKVRVGDGPAAFDAQIDWAFAIASKEVTVDQFRRFRIDQEFVRKYSPTGDCPANNRYWYDAAEYCNWLSEQEGLPQDQWCYLPNSEGKFAPEMRLAPDNLKRTGYRLPTEGEWQYCCQAGTSTTFSFGEPLELVHKYAWFNTNALGVSHPVGTLKPNDMGMFDMQGNVSEWCQDLYDGQPLAGVDAELIARNVTRVYRGGGWFNDPLGLQWSRRPFSIPGATDLARGFRVARTLPSGFLPVLSSK